MHYSAIKRQDSSFDLSDQDIIGEIKLHDGKQSLDVKENKNDMVKLK